jgi:glycosyltransferase involved in cell wall biosynthesis
LSKKQLLIVGAFPKKDKIIFGGIARSCNLILKSPISDTYNIVQFDSSQISNPPPSFIVRARLASKRLLSFLFHIIKLRPDSVLIFCSDGSSALEKGLMIYICKLCKIPSLIFPRAGNLIKQSEDSIIFFKIVKFFFSKASIFLCQGKSWKDFALKKLLLPHNTVILINNWTADSKKLEIGMRKNYEQTGAIKFIFIGWVEKFKGIHELMNACKHLVDQGHNFSLTVVGGGHAIKSISQFITKHKLEDVVDLCGWVDPNKLDNILSNHDVFVLPSWSEGFPNSMIEAMACGLTPIVTPVGAIPNFVQDDEHALLVPVRNEQRLAQAMKALICDQSLRERLGRNAYLLSKREFSSTQALKKLSNAIDESLIYN